MNMGSSVEALPDVRAPLLQQDSTTASITCCGIEAALEIGADGRLTYTPSEPVVGVRGCCPCCKRNTYWSQRLQQQVPGWNVVGAALESPNSFRVWYCEASNKTDPELAAPHFKLRKTPPFVCATGTEAQGLVQQVRQGAAWHGKDKPPRVLAVINPCSGRGMAAKLFKQHVAPVLEDAAGMSVTCLITQHAGHATQLCAELNLDAVDVLVFVGGDGTVFEGLQGLLGRPDWDAARFLPIAHVPGGSGNGLANSCGLLDAPTAAYCICKGVVSPMDVASALQPPNKRMYLMLMATYGSMSNLDVGTEHLRWMGDTRFALGALWEILKGRSYHASIAWLPPLEQQSTTAATATTSSPCNNSSSIDIAGSSAPAEASFNHDDAASVSLHDFPAGPELPLLQQLGGRLPLSISQQLQQQHPGSSSCLPPSWQTYHKPLQMWSLFNPPFIAAAYKVNPMGQLHSGCMDMMWVNDLTGLSGRLQALDMQVKSQQGQHVTLPYVTKHKVCAMIFEPRDSDTCLMLDGEVVPAAPIFLEVHQGLIRVLINPAHREEPAADRSRQFVG